MTAPAFLKNNANTLPAHKPTLCRRQRGPCAEGLLAQYPDVNQTKPNSRVAPRSFGRCGACSVCGDGVGLAGTSDVSWRRDAWIEQPRTPAIRESPIDRARR